MANQKAHGLLSNIVVIRIVLIFLLVFYHAFAIYSGAWSPIDGYPDVPAYWWLDKLSYAFMLEMFVFISGYVFGFQVRTQGPKKLDARYLFLSKFKRLIIPCILFSLLYLIMFDTVMQPIHKTIYDLLNGVGHMWFLPMLFWCFVGIWIIEKLHLAPKIVIPVLIAISLVSYLPLPLRIVDAMYYMIFFYVGYILQKNNISADRFYTKKSSIIAFLLFCVVFPILTIIQRHIGNINSILGLSVDSNLIIKATRATMSIVLRMIYASTGLAALFFLVGCKEKARKGDIPQWIIRLSGLCFGVYLVQQFILKALYNHTKLPDILGYYALPWVGLAIALSGSVLIAYLMVKVKEKLLLKTHI